VAVQAAAGSVASAPAMPSATPIAASRSASASTIRCTCAARAPSAMRMADLRG